MIPAAPFKALQDVAKARSSAQQAGEYMGEIHSLLADSLPQVEAAVARATAGPAPLQEASAHLVLAGGKRVRPLTALLVDRVCGGDGTRVVPLAAAVELIHS